LQPALALGPLRLGRHGGHGWDPLPKPLIEADRQSRRFDTGRERRVELLELPGETPALGTTGKVDFHLPPLSGRQLVFLVIQDFAFNFQA
jgi:hypothetical protein